MFILIMATTFSAMPFVTTILKDYSDSYIRSEMKKIQSEMILIDIRKGEYDTLCNFGKTGFIINQLIEEKGKYVSCRTNKPVNDEALICTALSSNNYYCVDSAGVSCEVYSQPTKVYRCKNLSSL